jgi:hypothetical protein
MKFWLNVLVSLDQLANTLAGGNPDCTLSGRVGYLRYNENKLNWLAAILDFTFLPIEENHCVESWLTDNDNDYSDNFYRVVIISILGCALLYLPIRIIAYATR